MHRMEYTTLGDTGLEVSRICLGCMSFGGTDMIDWALEEEQAHEIVDRAIDLGINFFDTANVYSNGESEDILGNALGGYDRDRFVIATKTHPQRSPNAYPPTQASLGSNDGAGGLSRKAIEQDLRDSKDRLGVETIDLYQIHRWDYATPIEETLRTLDDAVRRGDVRYIGASSMWAYQFASALHTSDRNGLERFVSMQNHYNLAYREEEREMLPLCGENGIGVIPWSPLAGGYLARSHESLGETERGSNMEDSEWLSERMAAYHENGGKEINERIEELSDQRGVSMAQISLAWLLHQDPVTAPIVGVTSIEHLEDAAEAVEIELSNDDLEYLEAPYEPTEIEGHD